MTALLASGTLNAVPVLREYANRDDAFWAEGRTQVVVSLAVPVLGFGTAPTLVALFLYGRSSGWCRSRRRWHCR